MCKSCASTCEIMDARLHVDARACAWHTCERLHTYVHFLLVRVMRGHRSRPPILPLALTVNLSVSQLVSQSARVRATGS